MVSILVLDVDLGLGVGVLYSLLTFAFRMQYAKLTLLGRADGQKGDFIPLDLPEVRKGRCF